MLLNRLRGIALLMLIVTAQLMSSELEVEVKVKEDWGSGFCANVYVSNPSDTEQTWDIFFDAKGLITKLWNAEYSQDIDTLIAQASGAGWNNEVEPNETVKFGYCADRVEEDTTLNMPIAEALEVTQTKKEFWDGGACYRVEVFNQANQEIDWEVDFLAKGDIFTLWNANYTQEENSLKVVASGLDWNNNIDSEETVKFGYCANDVEEVIDIDDNTTTDTNTTDINDTTPITEPLALFNEFNVGFGGSSAIPFVSNEVGEKIWVSAINLTLDENIQSNDYYSNIKNFDAEAFDVLQDSLKNSKFLAFWFTEGWEESWFSLTKIQKAMDAGYVPIFNYWYFGDNLEGIPSASKQLAYTEDNKRVREFLNKLNGTKFLIMEPEFNKGEILSSESTQHEFASILGSAIDMIKEDSSDIYFSLAMTDTGSRSVNSVREGCGYETCALGDKNTWGKPSIIYNDLLDKLDFISFQEMLAQFSRDSSVSQTTSNPVPRGKSDTETGIEYLPERIANLTTYLKEKYNKPVLLPYIGIATATWNDVNENGSIEDVEVNYNGWESQVDTFYRDLSLMRNELKEKGLFGFAVMSLFDNPQHDEGGYQYFLQNEYHLGIIKSGATDSVDIASHGDIVPKMDIVSNIFDAQ